MKRIGIVLTNVLIMIGILLFVALYVGKEQRKLTAAQVAAFEDMTVAMERVTANYLEG